MSDLCLPAYSREAYEVIVHIAYYSTIQNQYRFIVKAQQGAELYFFGSAFTVFVKPSI